MELEKCFKVFCFSLFVSDELLAPSNTTTDSEKNKKKDEDFNDWTVVVFHHHPPRSRGGRCCYRRRRRCSVLIFYRLRVRVWIDDSVNGFIESTEDVSKYAKCTRFHERTM